MNAEQVIMPVLALEMMACGLGYYANTQSALARQRVELEGKFATAFPGLLDELKKGHVPTEGVSYSLIREGSGIIAINGIGQHSEGMKIIIEHAKKVCLNQGQLYFRIGN